MDVAKAPQRWPDSSDQGVSIWSLDPLRLPYLRDSIYIHYLEYISQTVCEQSARISWVGLIAIRVFINQKKKKRINE